MKLPRTYVEDVSSRQDGSAVLIGFTVKGGESTHHTVIDRRTARVLHRKLGKVLQEKAKVRK